jgi:hypothetical protein
MLISVVEKVHFGGIELQAVQGRNQSDLRRIQRSPWDAAKQMMLGDNQWRTRRMPSLPLN